MCTVYCLTHVAGSSLGCVSCAYAIKRCLCQIQASLSLRHAEQTQQAQSEVPESSFSKLMVLRDLTSRAGVLDLICTWPAVVSC